MDRHLKYMSIALKLAKKAEGKTSPNPLVGAVLVKSGKIIGEGYHKKAGLAHAEIEAFNDAAKKKNSLKGATL
ncbi:MAG: riboflavin biosynthesis protein RibD, partial [Deltaproteobacteria bacterium]|nr:riboflavin biosynthesis protein RibD [Deltaproteobacteria bacterium]